MVVSYQQPRIATKLHTQCQNKFWTAVIATRNTFWLKCGLASAKFRHFISNYLECERQISVNSVHNFLACKTYTNFWFMWPCSVTNFFLIKRTSSTNFTNLFCQENLRVSGSSCAHHQEFSSVHSALVYVIKPARHVIVPNIQWKIPDDGQRNCPKHVQFLDKNKFGKLVRLLVLLKIKKSLYYFEYYPL
jgi:hypothetical protein